MARPAAPADPAAVGAALSPELRRALGELCDLLGIRPAAWQSSPLGAPFVTAAAVLRAGRIRQAEPDTSTARALRRACREFGIPYKTIEKRLREWAAASVKETNHSGRNTTRRSSGRTIEPDEAAA